jgi:hypothetical protein
MASPQTYAIAGSTVPVVNISARPPQAAANTAAQAMAITTKADPA